MELSTFFIDFKTTCFDNHPVIIFEGCNYPSLFFEMFRRYITKETVQPFKFISLEQDITEIQRELSTTFLGQRYFYWLGNIADVSNAKKKQELLKFLQEYGGPHTLFIFVGEGDIVKQKAEESYLKIKIEQNYGYNQIKKISLLYDQQNFDRSVHFFLQLYKIKQEYSLDQLCLLKEYASVVGKNIEAFFDEWIEHLVVSDITLFQLSQLFFSKDVQPFFEEWHKIRGKYSDMFWIAFWSEQLFKAYFYVHYKGHVPADQKQLTFGLPFSFMKQDWQYYSLESIQKMHQQLYEVDGALKSGGNIYLLDLFFMKFLS